MTVPLVPQRWPHIRFTEHGQHRFAEVVSFLHALETEKHPLGEEIVNDFISRLDYLDSFGGQVSDTDDRHRYRVTLGRDWAPHSFSIVWEMLDLQAGTYDYAFQGGLIWHGGPGDPLCVTLTPQWFGIHT